MAFNLLTIDSTTGETKRSSLTTSDVLSYINNEYTVAGSVSSFIGIVSGTITSSSKLDVYRNGLLQDEGDDYTRNVGSNGINASPSFPINSKILIRVYSG